MNKLLAAVACATVVAAPLAMAPSESMAAPHGGGFHGGYGGFRGGYGGFRGGYYGWGGYGWGYGFGLGAALWDPWFYDYPPYYYAYYPAPYYYGDYGYAPPPRPPAQTGAAPAQSQAPSGAACGNWSWNSAQSKYDWIPCPPAAAH
jgi:hypothetical protein